MKYSVEHFFYRDIWVSKKKESAECFSSPEERFFSESLENAPTCANAERKWMWIFQYALTSSLDICPDGCTRNGFVALYRNDVYCADWDVGMGDTVIENHLVLVKNPFSGYANIQNIGERNAIFLGPDAFSNCVFLGSIEHASAYPVYTTMSHLVVVRRPVRQKYQELFKTYINTIVHGIEERDDRLSDSVTKIA